MKVLVVGTGAVGAAVAAVARRRGFFERMTFADLDPARPAAVLARDGDDRFAAAQVDAGDKDALVGLLRETGADAILNAADPRFNPPILEAALEYGCTYLDMAMTLSGPDVLLGQHELEAHERWQERGLEDDRLMPVLAHRPVVVDDVVEVDGSVAPVLALSGDECPGAGLAPHAVAERCRIGKGRRDDIPRRHLEVAYAHRLGRVEA